MWAVFRALDRGWPVAEINRLTRTVTESLRDIVWFIRPDTKTVGALAHPLPDGGYVVDTPGLREIDVGAWTGRSAHSSALEARCSSPP